MYNKMDVKIIENGVNKDGVEEFIILLDRDNAIDVLKLTKTELIQFKKKLFKSVENLNIK